MHTRLTGAGGAGNQHVRHLGNVTDDRLAGDVLPTAGQAAFRIRERRRTDTPSRIKTVLTVLFGTFDADRDLIRDRRDTHVRRTERQRNVVRQGGDARDFDAARDGQLNRVTDGPRTMPMICASMLNESSVSSRHAELSRSFGFCAPRQRRACPVSAGRSAGSRRPAWALSGSRRWRYSWLPARSPRCSRFFST